MNATVSGGVLLALDTGVRESGCVVLGAEPSPVTGVIKTGPRRRLNAQGKVDLLLERLDQIIVRWRPTELVHSLPSGIRWQVPALELLECSLAALVERHRLPLYRYTSQEVRSAIAGHPNASRDQLGYAVMMNLGLIGQTRTTQEWEALAVGHYHLRKRPPGSSPTTARGV